jgi:anti-sigma factor RsiW
MNCEPVQRLLDASLDHELDPATQSEVQVHLKSCASCMALQSERLALRTAIRQLPRHTASPALRSQLGQRLDAVDTSTRPSAQAADCAQQAARPPNFLPLPSGLASAWARLQQALPLRWLLATLACTMAAFVIGHWAGGLPGATDLRDATIAQHLASFDGSALRISIASSDRHTVKPWFAGKLDFAPTVRDLSPQGFALLGGRLDTVAGDPAAVLVYQLRKHQLSVFILRAKGTAERPLVVSTLHGFAIASWVHDGLAHAAVSDIDPREIQRFAQAMLAPALAQ